MDKLLQMTKAGACLSGLDPLFVAHVLQHRSADDETNDHIATAPALSGDGLIRTSFQIELIKDRCEHLWPSQQCLFSVLLRHDELCRRRLFVWQDPGFVLCAVLECDLSHDLISGSFLSGDNPFALDRQSELHAIAYRGMVKQMIAQQMAALVSRLASYDMGQEMAQALARHLNANQAKQFLEGLHGDLLRLAEPRMPRS